MLKRCFALLLTCALLLSGCGGEEPAPDAPQQEENVALNEFRAGIEDAEAQIAAAYLGYTEAADYEEICAYLETNGFYECYPFLEEMTQEQFVQQEGGELYLVVPASAETSLAVFECVMNEATYDIMAGTELLSLEAGEPVLLQGNVSEIVPNLWVMVKAEESVVLEYIPSLSMMDGTLSQGDGVYDCSDYELILAAWNDGYAETDVDTDVSGSCVSVHYAADLGINWDDYDWVIVDDTLPLEAVFCTMVPVEDFTVVSLFWQEEGFEVTELFEYGTLTPEMPLCVILTDYGTIPSYGVSFVDPYGNPRLFGVTVSGMDGSLELTEIQ
ncbi:MAG: hypothetical protein IKU12_00055 [Oscillospiraceae bacterium]|nr:hypothetical protein [Oscillospiraceae bacterium]